MQLDHGRDEQEVDALQVLEVLLWLYCIVIPDAPVRR
jgi:hypothetical protein